ncbi:MAG: phosphomannomutase/phosphoglucomutase [Hydrotalea sp.]|nr:phosphomannomutase/phosphoglucomutase [Hydrotalea sp.]
MTNNFLPPRNYSLDKTILRQYDVRGIVGKTLHAHSAYLLAALLAQTLGADEKKVVVGGDGRLSTPELKSALVAGFVDYGVDVVELDGVVATPELYHANYLLQSPLAVQVTGSHNPKEYNGFKMVKNQKPFWGGDIAAFAGKTLPLKPDKPGKHETKNLRPQYIADLLKGITLPDNINVAWDAGNGALCLALEKILPQLKGKHHSINNFVDGNFPQHHPDPTVEKNLAQLQAVVKKEKCDLGIAFDGDGDRIGVVDEDGVVLWGDQLLILYSRLVLQKNKNAIIIADVKASQLFFDEVEKMGGRAVMAPTGHSIIKSEMKKQHSLLAGEMSGHIFFADRWPGFDDALYAALRLLEIIAVEGISLKQFRLSLPPMINTPEIRIDVREEDKMPIVEKLKAALKNAKIEFNDIDGLRVRSGRGWWLVRASNTQNCLVARAESDSADNLKKMITTINQFLAAAGAPTISDY